MRFAASRKDRVTKLILILAPLAVIVVLAISSCKDQRPDTSNLILPTSNVSYSRDIDPLFSQTCLGSQCHSGNSPAQGLNLEAPSYSKLRNFVPVLVVSGDTTSLLVRWIDGTYAPRMPSNQNKLTDNQINGIKVWIKEGIKDN